MSASGTNKKPILKSEVIETTPQCWFCDRTPPSTAVICDFCDGATIPTLRDIESLCWNDSSSAHGAPKSQRLEWRVFTFQEVPHPKRTLITKAGVQEALDVLESSDFVVIRIVSGDQNLLLRRWEYGQDIVLSTASGPVERGSVSRQAWSHDGGVLGRQGRATAVQEFVQHDI